MPDFGQVWINEIMPSNVASSAWIDNALEHDPWVELYNAGPVPVDMGAARYYLTDSYGNLTKWALPLGATIPAGGCLVVWVDGEVAETAPGHPHTNWRMNPRAPMTRPMGIANQFPPMSVSRYPLRSTAESPEL